jgi:hypothetical protein
MTRILRILSFLAVLLAVAVVPADGAAPSTEGWRAVPSPELRFPWELRDVAAIGGSDAVAVGWRTVPAGTRDDGPGVVLRWDGHRWAVDNRYPNRLGPDVADNLLAVDALSSSNVWAVGSTDFRPVAEHWDGKRWRGSTGVVNPEAGSEFVDVSIAGPSNVWAVANELVVPQLSPVAQRWDGSRWERFVLPHPFNAFVQVTAVESFGPNDVWAVGAGRSGATLDLLPIAWHWDGTAWSYVLMPRSGALQVTPTDLVAVSPTELWMVGFKLERLDSPGNLPVVQRFDGTAWQEVDGPDIPPGVYPHAVLNAVAPDGQGGIWAAGLVLPELVEPFPVTSYFAHFQNGSWTVEIEPDSMQGVISGLAQVPGTGSLWAAGVTRDELGGCGPCGGLIGRFGPEPPR